MEIIYLLFLTIYAPLCTCLTSEKKEVEGGELTQKEVFSNLLDGQSYDLNEWPHEHLGRRTDVTVQMDIKSFGTLRAATMDYNLDVVLRQRWTDPRLIRNATKDSVTIMDKSIQDRIWKPDTYFENVKEASFHAVTMPNILLRIYKNGDILYSMRLRMRLECNLELQQYPLDSQLCAVGIFSYANTMDVIKYQWREEGPVSSDGNLEISQFDLLRNYTLEYNTYKITGNYSGLYVVFSLRRQYGFHVLQTYIPTILIVAISWVSFWLDPNAVPGRVSLGVTTLLTITTLASGVRSQLPPVSYIKAIDVWVGMCMFMVFGALVEFTLVNWLANKKVPPGATPCRISNCMTLCFKKPDFDEDKYSEVPNKDDAEGGDTRITPATYIDQARAIDSISRALFPGLFVLFNLFYWPYYLTMQYTDPFE